MKSLSYIMSCSVKMRSPFYILRIHQRSSIQLNCKISRFYYMDYELTTFVRIVCLLLRFLGTGKTTTLVEYTKMRPMEKFLNVAYNKLVDIFLSSLTACHINGRLRRNRLDGQVVHYLFVGCELLRGNFKKEIGCI